MAFHTLSNHFVPSIRLQVHVSNASYLLLKSLKMWKIINWEINQFIFKSDVQGTREWINIRIVKRRDGPLSEILNSLYEIRPLRSSLWLTVADVTVLLSIPYYCNNFPLPYVMDKSYSLFDAQQAENSRPWPALTTPLPYFRDCFGNVYRNDDTAKNCLCPQHPTYMERSLFPQSDPNRHLMQSSCPLCKPKHQNSSIRLCV